MQDVHFRRFHRVEVFEKNSNGEEVTRGVYHEAAVRKPRRVRDCDGRVDNRRAAVRELKERFEAVESAPYRFCYDTRDTADG